MSVVVLPAVVDDMRAVEAVRIATWKTAYRGLLPDDLLDELRLDDDRVSQLTARFGDDEFDVLVAVAGEQVVGFASSGACRDEDLPGARELWAVYVLPEHWDTGAGAALVAAAGEIDVVWVLEGNVRARAFYERQGFQPDGSTKELERLGPGVTELRYARP